jgi:hypothetical protein
MSSESVALSSFRSRDAKTSHEKIHERDNESRECGILARDNLAHFDGGGSGGGNANPQNRQTGVERNGAGECMSNVYRCISRGEITLADTLLVAARRRP